MKKIKLLISALSVFFLSSLHAQGLKNYVCVVRGNLSNESKYFLDSLKESLENEGYSYYSKYVEYFLNGSFGSGFIWYGPDKKAYIVTNRHVINDYDSVNISFEKEDGSVTEFKDLKITFYDDMVDIALIALPENFNKSGLNFFLGKISDGDDVFSAGFPGLAGKPGWQLGKGIVSNSSARIKELINPEISTIIQHTAQVDGGNSGGPLLVKVDSDPAGYSVCGINTWKSSSRQNTNFAIPSSTIQSVVKENFLSKDKNNLDNRTKKLALYTSENKDFSSIAPFISNSMVDKYGWEALKNILETAPSSVRSAVSDAFEQNPLEGLRYSLSYSIWSLMDLENQRLNISSLSEESSGKRVEMSAGDKKFSSFWIQEGGKWKISDFEGIKAGKASNKKESKQQGSDFSIEDPYSLSFSAGYLKNFTEDSDGLYMDFLFRYDFAAFGFSLMTDSVTAKGGDDSFYYRTNEEITNELTAIGPFAQVKVPFRINNFILMPFAEAHAGIVFCSDFENSTVSPFFTGLGAGVECAWCPDIPLSPFAGVKCLYNSYYGDDGNTYPVYNLTIYAGLKFSEK